MAAPVKSTIVAAALTKKGMVRKNAPHHVVYTKTVDGLLALKTRISRSSPLINDYLMGAMANECCLPLREFRQLIACPLGEEHWEKRVRELSPDGRNPFLRSGH